MSDWRRVFISRCVFQIIDEIERSEGEESFDGELSEAVSQDRDHDVGDDLIIVGQLSVSCLHTFISSVYANCLLKLGLVI